MQIWSAEIKELELLYTSIKGRFPELEKELGQLIETKDANVVMLYSRRCLEIIVTDLCESELKRPRKTEPLKGIIDKLHREEKVPSHIITSMDHLNSLSTYGTHPKDFDPEQVKPVLNNLAIIIKWYFKYKDEQIFGKVKPEQAKYESMEPVDAREGTLKPKKRLILILSGFTLVIVTIIVAIVFFNIIGDSNRTQASIITKKTIAVLPFENLSDDPEQEYFSGGITDDILNYLSKISDLGVKSRKSTLQYKGTKKTIPEIGDELSVDAVLEGSVRKAGNKVRIVAQLIDVKTDIYIWSETYDREITDIFSIQSEIAIEIANTLQVKLTDPEKENINAKASTDIIVYDYYLKARQLWYDWNLKGTKKELDNILQLLKQAIDLDPDFASAYCLIGSVLHYGMRFFGVSTEIWIDSALTLSEKTIELDPSLPEGYLLRSYIYQYSLGRQEEAKKDLERAYKLAPSNPDVLASLSDLYLSEGNYKLSASMDVKRVILGYTKKDRAYYFLWGWYYANMDEYEKAEKLFIYGMKLDPGFWSCFDLGQVYQLSGKYQEAIEMFEKALAINPNPLNLNHVLFDRLGWNYFLSGNLEKAEEYWSKYKEIEQKFTDTSQYVPFRHRLAYVKWLKGEKEEAMSLFQEQMKRDKETQQGLRGYGAWENKGYFWDLGVVNAFLGNKEEAYILLDSAVNYGFFSVWYADHDPLLDGIRQEERFQTIIRKEREKGEMIKNAYKEVMNQPEVKDNLKWFFNK